MKRSLSFLAITALMGSHASSIAKVSVSSDFIEAGRANVYFDSQEPSADGYYVSGRKLISDNFYLVGEYFNTRVDSFGFRVVDLGDRERVDRLSANDDFKELSIGLGYLYQISNSSFFRFEAKYYDFEQERRSNFSRTFNNPLEIEQDVTYQRAESTGSIIEAGYKAKAFNSFEFEIGVGYRHIDAATGMYTELSASYLLGDNWKVSLSTEQGDTDRYMLGVGYAF
ncbi:hypothetical protein [Glaciecola sp. MF2-115]|uniref:hypothetical protein n=1 Tax=Glaciecola sp. MF2-115 TaxID=3384827 RepID=UPI0039A211E4